MGLMIARSITSARNVTCVPCILKVGQEPEIGYLSDPLYMTRFQTRII